MTVAVLALQGAFAEHENVLKRLGVDCIELRQAKDLETPYDGIILPGGESTVQGKLLKELGMFDTIKEQIENGGPVTVTHPDIIRFFMTIPEACRLVMEAATMGEGNEIFVFEMGKAVKIVDLATRMIELAGYRPGEDIKIEFTGLRPGEKLYEEVLSDKENTVPTENKKIMIAKVRRYEYADILDTYAQFEKLSRAVKIMDTVRLMKKVVPEFKSKNSPRFEVLDKE